MRGAVQGVGFRPHVFRLAERMSLRGWVQNSAEGVVIEVEGPVEAMQTFLLQVESERPPRSSIHSLESSWLAPGGYTQFEVRGSDASGTTTAIVMADIEIGRAHV